MGEVSKNNSVRRYCFTIHYNEERTWDRASIDRANVKLLIAQQEKCPTTGSLHWQGYVEFGKTCRISAAKKILGCDWANLRIANGSREDNYVYCSKEESKIPGGESIKIGNFEDGGQGKKSSSKTEEIRDAIRSGETTLGKEITEGRVLNIGAIKYFERLAVELDRGYRRGNQTAAYLFGLTNIGKSHIAHEAFNGEPFYSKMPNNKWWTNYDGQANIIVDDWSGPATQEELDSWKRWIDKWPCEAESKGGSVILKSKTWIFTSNVNWTALPVFFDNALKRRFSVTGSDFFLTASFYLMTSSMMVRSP